MLSRVEGSRASLFPRWGRRDEAAPAPVVAPLGFSNPVFDVAGSAEPVRGRVGVSVLPRPCWAPTPLDSAPPP